MVSSGTCWQSYAPGIVFSALCMAAPPSCQEECSLIATPLRSAAGRALVPLEELVGLHLPEAEAKERSAGSHNAFARVC